MENKYSKEIVDFVRDNSTLLAGKYYVPNSIFRIEGDTIVEIGKDVPDDLAEAMMNAIYEAQEMSLGNISPQTGIA